MRDVNDVPERRPKGGVSKVLSARVPEWAYDLIYEYAEWQDDEKVADLVWRLPVREIVRRAIEARGDHNPKGGDDG